MQTAGHARFPFLPALMPSYTWLLPTLIGVFAGIVALVLLSFLLHRLLPPRVGVVTLAVTLRALPWSGWNG